MDIENLTSRLSDALDQLNRIDSLLHTARTALDSRASPDHVLNQIIIVGELLEGAIDQVDRAGIEAAKKSDRTNGAGPTGGSPEAACESREERDTHVIQTEIPTRLHDSITNYLLEVEGITDCLLGATQRGAWELSNNSLNGVASALYFRATALRREWRAGS